MKKILAFVTLLGFLTNFTCAPGTVKTGLVLGPAREPAKWARKTLETLTLPEKIGQMIALRCYGRFYSRDSEDWRFWKRMTEEWKVGGFVLFGGDIYETAHLTNALQSLSDLPLLIASDLERGLGTQLDGATLFPPLMSLGAADSEELAYAMGRITALEGRAVGIHQTYAPVVDVNVNPDNPIINTRSIGEDPEQVSRISRAFIRGCQEYGIMATAKHFPGHGDTALDSHTVLATIEGNRERLERVELYPFRSAVEAGVTSVMTAHLWIPALEPTPNLPATLSPKILTDLLRQDMGFQGLIVTDSMGMGGITRLYEPEEAAVKAVKAGVDMVLLPPRPDDVIPALIGAVRAGEISEARIDASVLRILEAKARLGLHRARTVDVEALPGKIALRDFREQAAAAFQRSLTLVKNEGDVLPIEDAGRTRIAVMCLSSDSGGFYAGRTFAAEVLRRNPSAFLFYAEPSTGQDLFERALEESKGADVRLVALFSRVTSGKGSVGMDLRQVEFLRRLAQDEVPLAAVSFGSPYFLRHFPEIDAYVCAYRDAGEAQAAAVRALLGESGFSGRLPVSIPGLYERGHGLRIE